MSGMFRHVVLAAGIGLSVVALATNAVFSSFVLIQLPPLVPHKLLVIVVLLGSLGSFCHLGLVVGSYPATSPLFL